MPSAITKEIMSEYYSRVFPTDALVRWLSYGESGAFLGRREFCFTLVGDVFTRFRSYNSEAALKAELVKSGPEKIDIGAIYNTSPDKKLTVQLIAEQRELVFDIDMSDYDTIRSCCSGKQVCVSCWTWMATAAHVLHNIMTVDFGIQHLLPVFSGRRGIHLWCFDTKSRLFTDEERNGLVGYCTVIGEKGAINIAGDLKFGSLHPTLHRVHNDIIAPRFNKLFLESYIAAGTNGSMVANANCIFENAKAARIIFDLYVSIEGQVLRTAGRDMQTRRCGLSIVLEEGAVWSKEMWDKCLKTVAPQAHVGVHFSAMYPRLDEKVSTRRDHLLKLPFCVHPGTGRLCVPLEWDQLDAFDPQVHPPSLDELLYEMGAIPSKWMQPLNSILDVLEKERGGVKREAKAEPNVTVKAEIGSP